MAAYARDVILTRESQTCSKIAVAVRRPESTIQAARGEARAAEADAGEHALE